MFDGVEHHFQQYFIYIMAVSFIGGGNWNTQRKPQAATSKCGYRAHEIKYILSLSTPTQIEKIRFCYY